MNDKPQIDKFRELARELGCDDDEEAFDERLRKIAPVSADAIAVLEGRLVRAESERSAWKGRSDEKYQMALLLVRGLEEQLRLARASQP